MCLWCYLGFVWVEEERGRGEGRENKEEKRHFDCCLIRGRKKEVGGKKPKKLSLR